METCQLPCLVELEEDIGKNKIQLHEETESENKMLNMSQTATSFEPDICEETSYHELRCPSNEELYNSMAYSFQVTSEEYEQLLNMTLQPSIYPSHCKFNEAYPQNRIDCSLENTDDQLFIEIVKEEIDSRPDANEETSIFDSTSFNIDDLDEDSLTLIKMTDPVDSAPDYRDFENPPDLVPEISVKKVVRIKPRKPMQLANYRSLITQAINSSPEKRMILTDIYRWIMEQVPFFKENEKGSKNGWKNCVRHTLSVNERFIRIKNTSNCRYSYWTVCEEGDFRTKFAEYPWISEVFKPEERKRVRRNLNRLSMPKSDKGDAKRVFKKPVQRVDLVSPPKQNIKKAAQKSAVRKVNSLSRTDNNSTLSVVKVKPQIEKVRKANQTNDSDRKVKIVDTKRSKRVIKTKQNTKPLLMQSKKKTSKRKTMMKEKENPKLMKRKKYAKRKVKEVAKEKITKTRLKKNTETVRRSNRRKAARKTRKFSF